MSDVNATATGRVIRVEKAIKRKRTSAVSVHPFRLDGVEGLDCADCPLPKRHECHASDYIYQEHFLRVSEVKT
jgi:hypothetical protein